MRVTILATALLLVAVGACGPAEEPIGATDDDFILPMGDVEDGRQAFMDLKCWGCHPVRGEEEMPETIAGLEGPELGPYQAAQSRAEIADSIISPSHVVPPEYRQGPLSQMGDFTEATSVRQLIDLIAYVRSLDSSR